MADESERLNAPISTKELERRWTAIRKAMESQHIDVLVMQNNNDFMGGYVKYFTDLPATNGYALSVVFPRAFWRTIKRCITREQLGNHNVETWRRTFLSRNSQLLWVLQTWRKRRRDYPKIMRRPEFGHVRFVELKTPGQAEAFLSRLPGAVVKTGGGVEMEKPMKGAAPAASAAWRNHGPASQVPA